MRYALVFACLFTAGYVALKIGSAFRDRDDALVAFSRQVRREAASQGWRYEVVGGREEGMLLYLRRDHFLSPNDAATQWKERKLDAVVVREEPARPWSELLPGAERILISEPARDLPRYSLLVRR